MSAKEEKKAAKAAAKREKQAAKAAAKRQKQEQKRKRRAGKNGFYGFLRALIYLPVKLMYPVKVLGKENLPLPGKVITVSNHLGSCDVILVAVNIKGYRRIIAKKELEKNKFVSGFLRRVGVITVDRGEADLSAMRKVMKAISYGEGITIFPEGTRNKSSEDMQEVKSGAALFALKGDMPIVPIMILHRQRLFHRNYMLVGEQFKLERDGTRVDSAAVAAGAAIVEEKMRATREELIARVEELKSKKRRRKAAPAGDSAPAEKSTPAGDGESATGDSEGE